MKERNIGIDLTRIVAFMSVPGIHFFLYTGFYERAINCPRMYLMTFIRTLCMICVPLFLIITGYLMSQRKIKLDRKELLTFYLKLSRIILIYIISELIIVYALASHNGDPLCMKDVFLSIMSFNYGYAWYVGMYIGLFLLIPFINAIWHNAVDKQQRKIIVAMFMLLTMAPSITNIFDLTSTEAFIHPWISSNTSKLLPDWWDGFYPITYYFIGAYIKDVDVKRIDSMKLFAVLILVLSAFSAFNIWKSYSTPFAQGKWQAWGGFENVVDSTLVFLLINSINFERISKKTSNVLRKIAGLTFSAYLLSIVSDEYIYERLNEFVPKITMRINYFPLVVFSVVITSLLLAAFVQLIYNLIMIVYRKALYREKQAA